MSVCLPSTGLSDISHTTAFVNSCWYNAMTPQRFNFIVKLTIIYRDPAFWFYKDVSLRYAAMHNVLIMWSDAKCHFNPLRS